MAQGKDDILVKSKPLRPVPCALRLSFTPTYPDHPFSYQYNEYFPPVPGH